MTSFNTVFCFVQIIWTKHSSCVNIVQQWNSLAFWVTNNPKYLVGTWTLCSSFCSFLSLNGLFRIKIRHSVVDTLNIIRHYSLSSKLKQLQMDFEILSDPGLVRWTCRLRRDGADALLPVCLLLPYGQPEALVTSPRWQGDLKHSEEWMVIGE